MSLDLRTAPFGPGASAILEQVLSEVRSGDPLAPATVLVPTNFVGIAARRSLAWSSSRGLAGVTFSTIYRLAELLGAAALAGENRRPVSTPVLAAAVRSVLAVEPGVFLRSREHPATEKALVAAHRELSNLASDVLDDLAGRSARAADVVRIHRAVDSQLRGRFYAEQDLLAAAGEAVQLDPTTSAALGPVVLHLPQRLTEPQGRFLRQLHERGTVVIIAGATGDAEVDSQNHAELARAGLSPTEAAPPQPAPERCAADRILSVSDADDEVRAVVREVMELAREGVPFDRMALLYGSEQPYARLLHEHLTAAQIPLNGAALGSVAESLVGRMALGLLALGDRNFHRVDLMALLNAAPVRSSGRLVPVSAWERISRAAGVVRGPEQWDHRLAVLVGDLRGDLEVIRTDPDRAWRVAGIERQIQRAEELQAFVAELAAELTKATGRFSWSQRCRWLQSILRRYLGGPRAREGWPSHEQLAADRVEAVLDRLAGLDEIEPRPSLGVFRRTLELELEGGLGRSGRFGEGILIGGLGMGVGLELEAVWILGMAEGLVPSHPRDDSLLPDRERLVAGGELRSRAQRLREQRTHYLAALQSAARSTLTFPRGDMRRSNERMPSRWLLETASHHEGRNVFTPQLPELVERDWFDESPSHVAGLLGTSRPPTRHEYDVLSVLSDRGGPNSGGYQLAAHDPAYGRGIELLEARASSRFTRFDGNLAGLPLPSPTDPEQVVSPTRLEAWSTCPHAFLMRHVLGIQPLDSPETLFSISAIERGKVIHAALDHWLTEVLLVGDDGAPWTESQLQRLLELATVECQRLEDRGLVGGSVRWRYERRAILGNLALLLQHDNQRRRGEGLQAVASELGFGLPHTSEGPLEYPLSDGRTLRFRGSADRVEMSRDGVLGVIDYKTGSDYAFRGLSEDNPDLRGKKLQLPVYAAAARRSFGAPDSPVAAAYWFVTAKRDFRLVTLPLSDAVAERLDEVLTTVVDGIAAGVFPPHPDEEKFSVFTSCAYCDPDDLGTRDRRREWDRKAGAPELRPYLRLADPDRAAVYDTAEVSASGESTT